MRTTAIVLSALLAVVLVLELKPGGTHTHSDPCGPVDQEPQKSGTQAAGVATLCLLNRERTARGLTPLRENPLLSAASLQHSQDMVKQDYFDHTARDGRSVGDRLRALGYGRGVNVSAGENIAYGVGTRGTPAAIVDIWMHSPPHRADILRPSFTEIGIGIALGAPEVKQSEEADASTYTTDFGGNYDPSLPNT